MVLRNVFIQEAVSSFLSAKKTNRALNIPINTRKRKARNGHSRERNVLYGVRIPFSEKSFCMSVCPGITGELSSVVSVGSSVVAGVSSPPGSGAHFSTRHSKNTCPSEAKARSPFTTKPSTGMP